MARSVSVGPILGLLLKPKYSVINTFVGEDFSPTNGLDIFIDLNAGVSALSTSAKFLNSLPFSENVEADIIANVLSVVKHWKDWSRKYEDTRIFLIWNDFEIAPLPEQETLKSYLVPYVNKFDQDRFSQLHYYWNEAIKRIEIILKYIPKSYMIHCDRFDSYVIPNIIDDYEKNGRKRIIITGNSLMTTYSLEKDTKVIYVKFKHQMVDPLMIVQSISNIDDEIMRTFIQNKVFYALLESVIGDFDRGLIGITQMGISSFANDLLRAVERNEVPSDPKSIESILPIIQPGYHDYLRKAYPLVDIHTHSMMIPQSSIEHVKSTMVDLYDIDSVSKLSVDGLNLIELL